MKFRISVREELRLGLVVPVMRASSWIPQGRVTRSLRRVLQRFDLPIRQGHWQIQKETFAITFLRRFEKNPRFHSEN
jgi:hypothetical protein